MVAKGTGRWVYFSFSGGSSPPPAAGSCLSYSPSSRKALRFVLLCSGLVKKVLTGAVFVAKIFAPVGAGASRGTGMFCIKVLALCDTRASRPVFIEACNKGVGEGPVDAPR